MLYLKESNTDLRGLCLSLHFPGRESELPDRTHLVSDAGSVVEWLAPVVLNSLPCRSVDAGLFILVSRRYHCVQRSTCCPHCQLPFPSCRQEVKNWKSLKWLSRAFVNYKFIHCFQQKVCEIKWTNCQECSGMSGVCFLRSHGVEVHKVRAGNSDTSLGIKLDLQSLRRRWKHGPAPNLQFLKLAEPHKQVWPNKSLDVISISLWPHTLSEFTLS